MLGGLEQNYESYYPGQTINRRISKYETLHSNQLNTPELCVCAGGFSIHTVCIREEMDFPYGSLPEATIFHMCGIL